MIGISVNFKDFSYLAVHQSPGSLMVLICFGSVLEMHDSPPPLQTHTATPHLNI